MRAPALAALAWLGGCSPTGPNTEIVLVLHSDLRAPAECDTLEIAVSSAAGHAAPLLIPLGAGDAAAPPFTIGLRPAGDPGPVTVTVSARLGEEVVVAQRAQAAFVRGDSRVLSMELLGACGGIGCPQGTTCGANGCRAEQISWLPPWSGRLPPAPVDNVPRVDAGPTFVVDLADDFEDGTMDPAKWAIGVSVVDVKGISKSQKLAEREGVLRIEPHVNRGGKAYTGYITASTRRLDLRGAEISVEVPEVAINGAHTVFAIDAATTSYLFRTRWASAFKRNLLTFEQGDPDPAAEAETLRAEAHRFWRFRHDTDSETLTWEVAPTSHGPWMVKRSAAVFGVSLGGASVSLYSGSADGVSITGVSRFDNFVLRRALLR